MLSDNLRVVRPYTPGEQPPADAHPIKLNTNECPKAPSILVKEAIASFDADTLRLYPDPSHTALVHKIADYHGVSPDMVMTGCGSDEVLALLFQTVFSSGKEILFPDITYSFYEVWAELYRVPYRTVPLAPDFTLRPEDYRGAPGGVIFANPNAPTGVSAPFPAVEQILRENQNVYVVVDEAYVDFGGVSVLPLLEVYSNLIVTRTFSKSRGLAGLRVGYAIADPEIIRHLLAVRFSFNSYTLNNIAIRAACAALSDEAWFINTIRENRKVLEKTAKSLAELGFTGPESAANFLFVTHPEHEARTLYRELKERQILVRHFDRPRIDNYLRITIGSDFEMKMLTRTLETLL